MKTCTRSIHERQGQVGQEPITVGIDGGYVRNWHDKKRNFEVIVGKSMALRCNDWETVERLGVKQP
jgi:hypothetical protein